MGNRDGHIGDIPRPGVPLHAPLQADLAASLSDALVAELREEDASRAQDAMEATVLSPGGTDRGTRNLAKDNGQASERGRVL